AINVDARQEVLFSGMMESRVHEKLLPQSHVVNGGLWYALAIILIRVIFNCNHHAQYHVLWLGVPLILLTQLHEISHEKCFEVFGTTNKLLGNIAVAYRELR
ncbi:hypothetical protein ACJX0J_030815, partial [Zea mays]